MARSFQPFISVIIASYNYEKYIGQTLESMTAQTYPNFEVLVIDDGSSDGSVDLIGQYALKDSRIKLLRHENGENKGLAASVKYALDQVKGDFTAFCESDDFWTPDHLQTYVDYLTRFPQTDLLTARAKIIGGDGITLAEYYEHSNVPLPKSSEKTGRKQRTVLEHYNLEFCTHYDLMRTLKKPRNVHYQLLNTCLFPTFSVVMVRTLKLKECDFNPPLRNGLDLWLWKQLDLTCKVGFIDKQLSYWRKTCESRVWENQDITALPDFVKQLNDFLPSSQRIKDKIYKKTRKIIREMIGIFYRKRNKNDCITLKILGFPVRKTPVCPQKKGDFS